MLLFLLVLVLMGLVIAVYLRQQQGYSQVDPAAAGEYNQVYNAEAGRTRKTIGVAMVRALPAEA